MRLVAFERARQSSCLRDRVLSGGSLKALIFPTSDRLERLSDPEFSTLNRVLAIIARTPKAEGENFIVKGFNRLR